MKLFLIILCIFIIGAIFLGFEWWKGLLGGILFLFIGLISGDTNNSGFGEGDFMDNYYYCDDNDNSCDCCD